MYIAAAAAAAAAAPSQHTGPVPAIAYRSAGVEAIYCSAVGQRGAQPLTLSGRVTGTPVHLPGCLARCLLMRRDLTSV